MKSYSPVIGRKEETKIKSEKQEMEMTEGCGEKSEDADHAEKPSMRIPSLWLLPLLGYFCLLGYMSQLLHHTMPRVVSVEEAGYDRFSEERAWTYLKQIVGDGPRVAGSPYHKQKGDDLMSLLEEVAALANQTVHVERQVVSGDFYLSYKHPYISAYRDATNMLAVLEGESGPDGSSILFNCHYDSVPTAPGASDNALFCAVLVETLTVMSRRNHKPRHNVIFLFNGAEENSLQASHGFLKHHYASNVTALVNLDSSGMNGKAVLFQVNDVRVLDAFASTTHAPHAQAIGEALFTSGLVPSDTDFRVFRDFGDIFGVDIAFTRYGHVYHTRFDSLELLETGVVQHAGDMISRLASRLADMHQLDVKTNSTKSAVYFDYLTLFMLSYSHTAAHVLDSLVAVLSLVTVGYYLTSCGFSWKMVKELLMTACAYVASFVTGALLVMLLTLLMRVTTRQLRYYSQGWLVVPMYWMPLLLVGVTMLKAFDEWRAGKRGLSRATRTLQAAAACRLVWSVVLLTLLCLPAAVTMRYAVSVPLLLCSLSSTVSITVVGKYRLPAWQHLLLELSLSLPAMLFVTTLALSLNALAIAIMGRSTTFTPDYYIAALNVLLVALTTMPVAGVETLLSARRAWLSVGAVAVLSLVLMFAPFATHHAGASPAPQRLSLFHVERTSYDRSGATLARSAGVWAGHTDALSPGAFLAHAALHNRTTRTDFAHDCAELLYCDLPVTTPRTLELVPYSVWVEFPAPPAFEPAVGLTLTERSCAGALCTLAFSMSGTEHNSVAILPRAGVALAGWSFESPVANVSSQHERPLYFVWTTQATYVGEPIVFPFALRLNVSEGINGLADELLDMSFNAHKTHHTHELSAPLQDLLLSLPDYFNVAPVITVRHNYVF